MEKFLKKLAKKIAKSDRFFIMKVSKTYISYKDQKGTVYSCQKDGRFYRFCYGRVVRVLCTRPTYESEYQKLGQVQVAQFFPIFSQYTDNPSFVYKTSLSYEKMV